MSSVSICRSLGDLDLLSAAHLLAIRMIPIEYAFELSKSLYRLSVLSLSYADHLFPRLLLWLTG